MAEQTYIKILDPVNYSRIIRYCILTVIAAELPLDKASGQSVMRVRQKADTAVS